MDRLLVRTVRGIEPLVAAEVSARFRVGELELGHREIRFRIAQLTRDIVHLGTADDAFLVLDEGPPVGHHRADLVQVRQAAAEIDLTKTSTRLAPIRTVATRSFDVSASFLGRRNYSRYDIEDAIGETLQAHTGWRYHSRRTGASVPGGLSLRVHLTQERTTLAVRVAAQPLHRRPYRIASRPGALHPPLARALALLAAPTGRGVLLDPFCGTGTIPIEAQLAHPHLHSLGVDIDAAAIGAARRNATAARTRVALLVADAGRLPVPDEAVDAVATNLPWGVRTRPAGTLRRGLDRLWAELARVLVLNGRLVLLASPPLPIPAPFEVTQRTRVRVSGAIAEIITLTRGCA